MQASPDERINRKLLVIVDETAEGRVALRYAARRAQHTHGRVALLYVIEPVGGQAWTAIEERMREEARDEAERVLYEWAKEIHHIVDLLPEFIIREGLKKEEVLAALATDRDIRLLVLGAAIAREGPGPMVAGLAASGPNYPVPVTIVPGGLSMEEIDALA